MLVFDKLFRVLIVFCSIAFLAFFLVIFGVIKNGQVQSSQDLKKLLKDRIITSISAITILFAIIVFGGGYIFERLVRNDLVNRLKNFDHARDKVIIDDILSDNSKEIIQEVVKLKSIMNSHPSGRKVRVTALINNSKINLVLERALNDSTVYLVYYPKYKTFKENSLGQIKTSSLSFVKKNTSTNKVQASGSALPRP